MASYITDTLIVGSHVVTVTYGGDASFTDSTDNLTQVVNRAATSTALTSRPNPSVYGQAVTFTATVTVTDSAGATSVDAVVIVASLPNNTNPTAAAGVDPGGPDRALGRGRRRSGLARGA